jgi:hypothetical protein
MLLKISLKKTLLFFWVFTFLCLRPSIFGERYNLVVFIVLSLISVFTLYLSRESLNWVEVKSFNLLLGIFVLISYLFIQGMILSSNARTVFNASFLVCGISIICFYMLRLDKQFIIKSIIDIHVIFSISSIITFSIVLLNGLNSDAVILRGASDFVRSYISPDKINGYEHDLMFPFTVHWSNVVLFGISLPRLLGIYREPGMAQIFFLTAYFLTYTIELRRPKQIRTILFVGSLLTFSTAGLLSFMAGYLVMWFYPRHKIKINLTKTLLILIAFPLIIIATLYAPNYGLLAKMDSISGNERIRSYQRSLTLITERPLFGWGYYNKSFESEESGSNGGHVDTLGLIGVTYQIGIVGVVLYLLLWFYSFYYFNDYRTHFILMPCLLTLLISQPSYNDMLVWFLLMFNFKSVVNNNATVQIA